MKNKIFVPVPVSERLPKNYGAYIVGYGTTKRFADFTERTNQDAWRISFDYWLEEREDRTAELVEMLKELLRVSDEGHISYFKGGFEEWEKELNSKTLEAKDLITSIEKGENNG